MINVENFILREAIRVEDRHLRFHRRENLLYYSEAQYLILHLLTLTSSFKKPHHKTKCIKRQDKFTRMILDQDKQDAASYLNRKISNKIGK